VQHAYALTGHAGQGLTVERAFVLGSDRGRLQEWGYVALSRARTETRLYLTETVGEPESHFHELDERDPTTRLAQALEHSGAERLASEQRSLPAGPRNASRPIIVRAEERERSRLRFLEKRQRETEQLRARAERRLAAAEERLARLGWRARRARGRELQGEIALQQSALRLVGEKLAQLEQERHQLLEHAARPEQAPTRPRRPEIGGRERTPERQLTLDLGL
ncbi:MAG: C-terminal helicase domain-containing protein, partial [Thermoleophilaceae bacterium]